MQGKLPPKQLLLSHATGGSWTNSGVCGPSASYGTCQLYSDNKLSKGHMFNSHVNRAYGGDWQVHMPLQSGRRVDAICCAQ